jgi:hypothetical protein
MKTEKQRRRGLFGKVLGLVTENWALKLLAFVLAIVIYYAMKPGDAGLQQKMKFERTDERIPFKP